MDVPSPEEEGKDRRGVGTREGSRPRFAGGVDIAFDKAKATPLVASGTDSRAIR